MAPKSSFAAVADCDTRLLLLGSLPGEVSLANTQYYAHPRNQFWRLTSAVIGVDLVAMAYEDRLAAVLAAGLGLWDVVASAERIGSLDVAIRLPTPNPLAAFVAALPKLRAVAFNGGKAGQMGTRLLADRGCALLTLPSSSPAHAVPYERKLAQWLQLRAYLGSAP